MPTAVDRKRRASKPRSRVQFTTDRGIFLWHRPRDKEEFALLANQLYGVRLAPTAACDGHSAPLDAIWDAYTAADSMVIWEASRGFGGKSTGMAILGTFELLDGATVNILGGSSQQSQRVQAAITGYWSRLIPLRDGSLAATPLRWLVSERPTMYITRSILGNQLTALTASSSSVRGPHPQRLLMDEVDEMKLSIFDAALGQTMDAEPVVGLDSVPIDAVLDGSEGPSLSALGEPIVYPAGTLLSSTHQYADGTMTEVKRRAKERGWLHHRWCYRETHVDNGGWLTQAQIDRKRREVADYMWEAEYELGEPNPEGRLFSADRLLDVFLHQLGTIEDRPDQLYQWDKPREGAKYVVGADWARDVDWTVIVVLRVDVEPHRLVAYLRTGRLPWPVMISRFDSVVEAYSPAAAVYDATGVGSVIEDYSHANKRILFPFNFSSAADRSQCYSDYIAAIESKKLLMPYVATVSAEHRYVRPGDIWGGISDGHVPDTVSALALAYSGVTGLARQHAARKGKVMPGGVGKVLRW